MAETPDRVRRRFLFQAAAAIGGAFSSRLFAREAVGYSVAVHPARAMLGDPIVAALSFVALHDDADALTFDDASLMLKLHRAPREEPVVSFPNRGGVETGLLLLRMRQVGHRSVRRGERLERNVDLLPLFPRWLLDTGTFRISCQLGEDDRAHLIGPVRAQIESGPEAVPRLLALLEHPDLGVRTRAAGLLHKMTGQMAGYAADSDPAQRLEAMGRWRGWWESDGGTLPWNFLSAGATFGVPPGSVPHSRRSRFAGGVAYELRPLDIEENREMEVALGAWLQDPSAAASALRGKVWIADQSIHYPGKGVMLSPAESKAKMLESAVSRLASLVGTASMEATGAGIILATVAKMPQRRFVAALSTLAHAAPRAEAWRPSRILAEGLLDLLDPGRVPVGAV